MEQDAVTARPRLLVVDDDVTIVRAIERLVRATCTVVGALSVASATTTLTGDEAWIGGIFDVCLPDGDGLALVAEFRARVPRAPTLVLSGVFERDLAHRVLSLGAQYAPKPAPPEGVRSFVAGCLTRAAEDPLDEAAADIARETGLSPAQGRVLRLAVHGASREDLCACLQISENTLRDHIRPLVRKCGAYHLDDVVRRVLKRIGRR